MMWTSKGNLTTAITVSVGLLVLVTGWINGSLITFCAGVVGLCGTGFQIRKLWKRVADDPVGQVNTQNTGAEMEPAEPVIRTTIEDTSNQDGLVREMLAQERYALLLRSQVVDDLSDSQLTVAQAALDQMMSLAPEGKYCWRSLNLRTRGR